MERCGYLLTICVNFASAKTSPLMMQEYDFDAPVRILEKMMHSLADTVDQQVVVLGQVLAAEINIGYEEIVNTQAGLPS